MNITNHLLCCDWGTSNFRLYLIEKSTQKIIGQIQANQGIATTFNLWKKENEKDRITFFRQFLQQQIDRLGEELKINLNQIPVVLSGMASSSIGMIEIPYKSLPFNIAQPNLTYQKIAVTTEFPNDLYIFTGLQNENDVMRGEEVQLLGLQNLLTENDCLCILPGTHSKHIFIEKGKIIDFKTYMTGELFQLLKTHSILKNSLVDAKNETLQVADFQKGVLKAQEGNILNHLFSVRTNDILHQMSAGGNQAFLSGLLIGTELHALQNYEGLIILGSNHSLFSFYKTAIEILNIGTDLKLISPEDLELAIPKAHLHLWSPNLLG